MSRVWALAASARALVARIVFIFAVLRRSSFLGCRSVVRETGQEVKSKHLTYEARVTGHTTSATFEPVLTPRTSIHLRR